MLFTFITKKNNNKKAEENEKVENDNSIEAMMLVMAEVIKKLLSG